MSACPSRRATGRAMSGGKPVYEARVQGGFASVKDDIVTVMTEALTE